ncbi:serine/threonine-protein kinase [Streptomyces sp. NPDC047130]|uniref:serine/threonine-protein kinase n=1 Tax=Streptomyces sp. NPDC047130 TaxID=3155261 RepID=UPI0033F294F2
MSRTAEVFQPLRAEDPAAVAGFRLAARLGAGGMGVVYLSHTQGGRPVAIKVVRPELADDPDFRRRFGREIKAARRVRGAYTAELIDGDADGTPPWLATLYVPGPSLTEAVARRGPLPVTAVLWLMAGVAEALQAIHGAGIVHRDLKPSNVLLAADGPRVIDFGIAMAADGTAYTATGGAIGTPSFMAPEQAVGEEVTAATDVFALGQTAAFAALGRPLYGEGSAVNLLYRIVHSEPDLSQVPEPLRPVLARCLAMDPAERPTPAEVVEWCRERLDAEEADGAVGADGAGTAGAGAPLAWREIAGPEVTVPAPASEQAPLVATQRLDGLPQPTVAWPGPPPGWQRPRRRRSALLTGVGVTAGALLMAALAWKVVDVSGGLGRLVVGEAADSGDGRIEARESVSPEDAAGSGGSAGSAADSAAEEGSKAADDKGGDGAGDGSGSLPRTPEKPVATPYAQVWVDAKKSVDLADPKEQLPGDKGEIRFGCANAGCELKSDSAVFSWLPGDPGQGSYDTCSMMLEHAKARTLLLAAMANGSEICVKNSNGDIALMVIQVKSTAMPDLAFLTADMTVWRKAD